jgi:hypothetical protein
MKRYRAAAQDGRFSGISHIAFSRLVSIQKFANLLGFKEGENFNFGNIIHELVKKLSLGFYSGSMPLPFHDSLP